MPSFTNYFINILGDDQKAKNALRFIPIFSSPSKSLIELIFRYGKVVHLQNGETLIKQGEFDQWIYVILQGSLSVIVEGKNIDRVSSMVGERCLFGEPRSATLNAFGEVHAFGIDMSLVNSLTKSAADIESKLALVELLSLITDQVLLRVMNLWFTLSYLKEYGKKNLENVGEKQLLEAFYSGDLVLHPSIMSLLWLMVKKSVPENFYEYWDQKTDSLNLRKLAFDLTKNKRQYLLLDWAHELFNWCQRNKILSLTSPYTPEELDFEKIYLPFLDTLKTELFDQNLFQKIEALHAKFFGLNENGNLSLKNLREFLVQEGLSISDLTDVFFALLKTALDINQKLNQQIRQISQSHYLGAFLESEFFKEEKLFLRSKLTNQLTEFDELYTSLIKPYNENLQLMLNQTEDKNPKEPIPSKTEMKTEVEPSTLVDPSNFDALLKSLGATPGVPLE